MTFVNPVDRIQAKQQQVDGTLKALQRSRAVFFSQLVALTRQLQATSEEKQVMTQQLAKRAVYCHNVVSAYDTVQEDQQADPHTDGVKQMVSNGFLSLDHDLPWTLLLRLVNSLLQIHNTKVA
jgi:hypothetical protein